MRSWLLLLASLAGSTSVADIVSETIEATELTVYRDANRSTRELSLDDDYSSGIAMVTETRTIEIPAGASTIRFRGVADGIVPQTAALEGVPATLVEANFDYNLLSPGTLIAKSLDRPVRLIRTDHDTGRVEERQGVLRSGPDGVLIDFDGEIEALNCSGSNERLVFTDVPGSLSETPTLSMTIRAATAGTYQVQLSYLALGMDWSADYTARIHPDGRRMDISSWITLVNRNGSRFADAKTHVVAGTLARQEDETRAPDVERPLHVDHCWPIGDFRRRLRLAKRAGALPAPAPQQYMLTRAVEEILVTSLRSPRVSELGDYKLYTLPFATTVQPRQMKQTQLLDQRDVRFQRLYEHRITEDNLEDEDTFANVAMLLRIKNTKRNGLGLPLPAGTWRVIQMTDDGRQYLVGEQPLEDTPLDLERDIYFGKSNDVTVVHRLIEDEQEDEERAIVEIQLSNAGATAAEVEVLQAKDLIENASIVKESHRHQSKDGDYVWKLRVPPSKRTVLRYTMMVREP